LFNLLGLYYNHYRHARISKELENIEVPGESTQLMPKETRRTTRRSSVMELNQAFSRKTEVSRRSSVEIMGLSCLDIQNERTLRNMQLRDLEEFMALAEADFE
jgi:hypothetical protein